MMCNSNSVTFWKKQNYRDCKDRWFSEIERWWDEEVKHRGVLGQ